MRDVDLKDYGEKFAFLGRQDGFSEREITEIDLSSGMKPVRDHYLTQACVNVLCT